MDQPRLVPADTVSLETLTAAFNRGFEGYLVPLSQTPDSLRTMIRTNDVDVAASVVALAPDDAPVGVGLLAVRGERGWVGGMGIAPEWRGQGHGAAIMRALIERARVAGLRRLQLEVLESNTAAHHLYERLGFVEERPLLIFTGRPPVPYSAASPGTGEEVRDLPTAEALDHFDEQHAFVVPCWQREQPSLRQMAAGLRALGLVAPAGLRATILYNPTVASIAVLDAGTRGTDATERARQVGVLVGSLLASTPDASLRAINVPPEDPLGDVLTALGCAVVARQREMSLGLIG
jgi:GNAT superfamily N-acetyltransferase